jgi:hypothetical protein
MKKYDAVLYAILLAAFLASAALVLAPGASGTPMLEVIRDGVTELPPTDMDSLSGRALRFGGPGNFNEITISGGAAAMTSADCEGGDCMSAGAISRAGEMLVCLPHKLVARIIVKSGGESLDALSY